MSLSVSVIIPAYNHARYIAETLDSVLAQTYPIHEIIVVDDGSTDETPQVLAAYGDHLRVLRKTNEGAAAARNSGLEIATGDLIAFVDADDIWLPHKLESQVRCFEQGAAAGSPLGLVHCGMEEVDAGGESICQRTDGLAGAVAEEMLLWRRVVILGGGSGVVMPRKVIQEVGGFDASLSVSCDWDLYLRIALRYPVGFVAGPLLKYRLHGANMHKNIRAMERDMLRVYRKAFASQRGLRRLRRRAYANLYAVLAGSYLSNKQYRNFLRMAWRSAVLVPDNLARFKGFWVHWWQRRRAKESA